MKMFARFAIPITRPAAFAAAARPRTLNQVRLLATEAISTGSHGRAMPARANTATAPVASMPATFTIRVSIHLLFCHPAAYWR